MEQTKERRPAKAKGLLADPKFRRSIERELREFRNAVLSGAQKLIKTSQDDWRKAKQKAITDHRAAVAEAHIEQAEYDMVLIEHLKEADVDWNS